MELLNQYNRRARIYPAVLCIVPILIFYYYFLKNEIFDFLIFAKDFTKVVGDITLPLLSVIFFAQFGRIVGKFIYEKIYYQDQLLMPTTNYLLHKNKKYSDDYKTAIYSNIEKDFGLILSTMNEEQENEAVARKKIVEAVGLIREKVKDGRLLLQHNIEYGLIRNLIGGSAIALIFSIFNLYFFIFAHLNRSAVIMSIICIIIYSIPVIFSKILIGNLGNIYAEILFKEYLSI
jgi:hypothetical protein